MNEVEAKKVKKISWTETVGNMVVGAVLICSLKEKLSAGSIISRYKKEKPEVEFSKWKEVGKDKYQVTRLK